MIIDKIKKKIYLQRCKRVAKSYGNNFKVNGESYTTPNTSLGNNVNFNGISSSMYLRFFITKEMADKVDDTCHLQPELFDKNNIIKDIVEVTFSYDFIGNANELAEDYLNNPFEPLDMKFLINYERFIKLLSERGFNVSITTFEDALNSAIEGNQPIITADFTKKSEFKK